MARRIIGQCNTADFKDIEHLATLASMGKSIYPSNMTGRQTAAVMVVHHFQTCGVPFKILLKLREVLVWQMPDNSLAFEYKLLDSRDTETQNVLWSMRPQELNNKKGGKN